MSPAASLLLSLSLPTAQLQTLAQGLLVGHPDGLRVVVVANLIYVAGAVWKGGGEAARVRAGLAGVIGVLLPVGLWFDGQPLHACGAAVLGLLLPYAVLD